ncbi:RNA-binding S4 domain-containing protein [Candidatus Sordicultor fermentans]|uniref:RNA-binding S4 domain-containing protein n=1 Tax=Candidatus Sordicultor fermentans TaxID=1953203 RepID=UPI00168EA0FA|nr:RNA-binding S4 domain-containing protein [Candidatus Atribacteria bacterium]
MRLDKFLKSSSLIKRRPLAQAACKGGRVLVNGKVAKPGTGLKLEDEITIFTSAYKIVVRVKSLSEKERGEELYEVIKKDRLEE